MVLTFSETFIHEFQGQEVVHVNCAYHAHYSNESVIHVPRIGRLRTSCRVEWLVFPSIGKQAESTLFYLEPITIADGQTGRYSADDKYHPTLQDMPCPAAGIS
jgi:hypothetical protein